MGNTQNNIPMILRCTSYAKVTVIVLVALVAMTRSAVSLGQSSVSMAERLRQNTVRIHAGDDGFGFIAGEGNGFLYIVTARHVLIGGEQPDSPVPTKAVVSFYSDQGTTYNADILGTHEGDLAVLKLPTPAGFHWERTCLAGMDKSKRGSQVWFVGRRKEWYVPAQPGSIASDQPSAKSQIEIDGLSVSRGTSGAPVIADSGIVGMIQSDSSDDTRALTIDFIQRAFHEWNYPWSLQPGAAVDEPAPAPTQACSVTIDSDPSGSRVYLDSVARGETPTHLDLVRNKTYTLSVKRDGYQAHEEKIDCETGSVNAQLQARTARITIGYAGDWYACSLLLNMKIAEQRFRPTSNQVEVHGVPIGEQNYRVDGEIGCPTAGMCQVTGSGSIDVQDGATFNVVWSNTGYAKCSVVLVPQ